MERLAFIVSFYNPLTKKPPGANPKAAFKYPSDLFRKVFRQILAHVKHADLRFPLKNRS